MFAIVDCNNFYAACERLFQPKLNNRPVVVLSNNDGCVIARSDEAKALGIAMGFPFFKVKRFCKAHDVAVFSSNYALYGDLSQRVMCTIEAAWPDVEVYSIDEAFLDLKTLPAEKRLLFCYQLHQRILQHIGIPVTIGIGPTKTLAKLANEVAKRRLKIPVLDITLLQQQWLPRLGIETVWGVGKQWAKVLSALGVTTAYALQQSDPQWIRQRTNRTLAQTVLELQGQPCFSLTVHATKKGIQASRSFATPERELKVIKQALATYCNIAAKKLRAQQSLAKRISVTLRTSQFNKKEAMHLSYKNVQLPYPTADVRDITQAALFALKTIFKAGYGYKKVGVWLGDFQSSSQIQQDLWQPLRLSERRQSERLMRVYDEINHRYGDHGIKLAVEGDNKFRQSVSQLRSPCFTTRWSDLPKVK